MAVKKQNLFLFFEESEFEFDISSNFVRLSMNRLIVDEEAQFEIIGIYNLKKSRREMIDFEHPDYKKFAKERTEKEAFDKDLVFEVMEKAFLHHTTSADAHFIIGSAFHVGIRASLFGWISSEIKDIGLESLYCTVYFGSREYLITKELSDACYDGQKFIDRTKQRDLPLKLFDNMKSSINDDLEDFVHQIRNGCRPSMNLSNEMVMLYLHKMLTKIELKKVHNADSQFWNSIVDKEGILRTSEAPEFGPEVSYKDIIKINKPKFVLCFGKRLTRLLQ